MIKKLFVEVTAKFDVNGKIIPLTFSLSNGQKYNIINIIEVKRAASLKAGGIGTRYRVNIGSKEIYLFFEDPRWFVEAQSQCADDIP